MEEEEREEGGEGGGRIIGGKGGGGISVAWRRRDGGDAHGPPRPGMHDRYRVEVEEELLAVASQRWEWKCVRDIKALAQLRSKPALFTPKDSNQASFESQSVNLRQMIDGSICRRLL